MPEAKKTEADVDGANYQPIGRDGGRDDPGGGPLQVRGKLDDIPYIECKARTIEMNKFYRSGQAVDFYIDQVRYLPDCATCTRLLIRGITSQQVKILNTSKAFMDINQSTRMVQTYDFRWEIRPEDQITKSDSLNPTTYIEIVVETIDRSDMLEKIVGYAYFPLFLTKDGNQPPNNPKEPKFLFNEGSYQIPIYYERIPSGTNIDMQKVTALPKIRCATICLRSFVCP